MLKPHKLVIIGVGHVGSLVLKTALDSGLFAEIALIDIKPSLALGEALDAEHALTSSDLFSGRVYEGDYRDCADADVIICAAGQSILPGDKLDRQILASRTLPVITGIMTEVTRYTREAVLILITNPLDIVTYHAASHFGYTQGHIFGTGTTLETLRFHSILGRLLKVAPQEIHGFILGEHGNSAFAAFSTVSVGGIPFAQLQEHFAKVQLKEQDLEQQVINVAYEVMQDKGWTNTGIAQGVIRLARAVLKDERVILPVSAPLKGAYGFYDVALSLPAIIGRHGIEQVLQLKLTAQELDRLHRSAAVLQHILRDHKLIG